MTAGFHTDRASTRHFRAFALLLMALLAPGALAQSDSADAPTAAIDSVLDDFHAAAAEADAARYLGHFADNGVFLGTDDWERWPLENFRAYVAERFANGGWTYYPRQRNVAVQGDVAWFDEIVESPRWGRFRGTGVLMHRDGRWRIAHYALSFLVPNENWEAVSELARAGFRARAAETSP
jgi:ketosteroid isomerase-like protein